jgi:hypothetical protein
MLNYIIKSNKLKKAINISIITSLISTITFLILTLSQVFFFNSFSLLIFSLSIFISGISLKLLENLSKIKLILFISILFNSLIGVSLFTEGVLREYEWLTFTPLLILAGIALSQSIKNKNHLNTFTIIGLSLSTILITVNMIMKVENSVFYTTTFTLLTISSIAFFIGLFKEK